MLLMSKVQVFIEADEDRDNVYLMDIILPEVLITPLKRQITHHNGTIIKNCNSIERIGTMMSYLPVQAKWEGHASHAVR
jgi:hypothetical protein